MLPAYYSQKNLLIIISKSRIKLLQKSHSILHFVALLLLPHNMQQLVHLYSIDINIAIK